MKTKFVVSLHRGKHLVGEGALYIGRCLTCNNNTEIRWYGLKHDGAFECPKCKTRSNRDAVVMSDNRSLSKRSQPDIITNIFYGPTKNGNFRIAFYGSIHGNVANRLLVTGATDTAFIFKKNGNVVYMHEVRNIRTKDYVRDICDITYNGNYSQNLSYFYPIDRDLDLITAAFNEWIQSVNLTKPFYGSEPKSIDDFRNQLLLHTRNLSDDAIRLMDAEHCWPKKLRRPKFYVDVADIPREMATCLKRRKVRSTVLELSPAKALSLGARLPSVKALNEIKDTELVSRALRICDSPNSAAQYCQRYEEVMHNPQFPGKLRRWMSVNLDKDAVRDAYDIVDGYRMASEVLSIDEIRELASNAQSPKEFHDDAIVRARESMMAAANERYRRFEYEPELKSVEMEVNGYKFRPAHPIELESVGNSMHICVGGYADSVVSRRCSIVVVNDNYACIEILPGGVVVQAKMKYNKPLYKDKELLDAVRRWMLLSNLTADSSDLDQCCDNLELVEGIEDPVGDNMLEDIAWYDADPAWPYN